ncbi:MAG: hypothetical protein NC339_00065 [Muribaculaceae bacterium]|nr:hypothetical protein [Muribaculaceae bacterium]
MNTNHKYDQWEVDKVRSLDIRLFIPGCNQHKATSEVECPHCGKKKLSVVHKGDKNFAYCHSCQFSLSGPIEAVAHFSGIDMKNDWLHALEETARQGGVILTPNERKKEDAVQTAKSATRSSFCSQQLDGSGLTFEDVLATTLEGSQETFRSPFRPGRVDEKFTPDESGSDMLIYYYDLQGRPVTYIGKGSARPRPYVRVRWANPALHKSSDGKEMKYQTPAGAPCRVYIPEKIRRMYKNKTHIETLFLQEGEKKAEKACKHGMLSIGIQGINNFGSQETGLLQDIQEIVVRCNVTNIVLIMDSDWNDLHHNIIVGDRADKRPNSFSRAVIKYRQYMKTFANMGLNMNIWWGHVNTNEHGDKGVDDLLCGSLLGREPELMEDLERTMNSHDGRGTWLNIHKITEESDTKRLFNNKCE